jgi:hypothetical protein
MKKLIEIAASKGFRTVVSIEGDLWVIGFEKNGKWSPPYSGFSMEEAVEEAMEDIVNVGGE